MNLLPFERKNVQAILEGFAPHDTEGGLAPLPGEVDYLFAFETVRLSGTERARLGVRVALWFTLLAPIWLGVAFCSMASLPVQQRAAILDRMLGSDVFIVRELALLMKIGAAFALMGAPSVRARSNYDRGRPERADERRKAEPVQLRPNRNAPRALPLVARTSGGM